MGALGFSVLLKDTLTCGLEEEQGIEPQTRSTSEPPPPWSTALRTLCIQGPFLSQVVGAVIGSATWPAPNALCVEEMALPFNLNPLANNPPLYEQML